MNLDELDAKYRNRFGQSEPWQHSITLAYPAISARIRELEQERDDYKSDSLRLHKDKCDALDELILVKLERDALQGQVAKCPIGLDANPLICSAGCCGVCMARRAATIAATHDAKLRDEVIDACIFLMEGEGKTHSAMLLRTLKTADAQIEKGKS